MVGVKQKGKEHTVDRNMEMISVWLRGNEEENSKRKRENLRKRAGNRHGEKKMTTKSKKDEVNDSQEVSTVPTGTVPVPRYVTEPYRI